MKRLFVIAVCLNFVLASAAWALGGCVELAKNLPQADPHSHSAKASHHHQGSDADHSHADPSRVHCASPFDEFLLTARMTIGARDAGGTVTSLGDYGQAQVVDRSAAVIYNHGPPGSLGVHSIPRHLMFSVLRI